jgi:hypothetical protein
MGRGLQSRSGLQQQSRLSLQSSSLGWDLKLHQQQRHTKLLLLLLELELQLLQLQRADCVDCVLHRSRLHPAAIPNIHSCMPWPQLLLLLGIKHAATALACCGELDRLAHTQIA